MAQVDDVEFHPGSRFPLPEADRWQPPTGQVTYLHAENAYVTSSGPSLALWLDLECPRGCGAQRVVVVRLLQRDRYMLTPLAQWQDGEQNLAVTLVLQLPEDGTVQQLYLALPYAVFPPRAGGKASLEIAVHDPAGDLDALAHFPVELPSEIERVPDVLSVTTHTLVAIARAVDGGLDADEQVEILALMIEHHGLDDLGETAIQRILATAVDTFHTPATLAEALRPVLPADTASFVELLYASARADADVQPAEQAFIDELLALLGVYDHVHRGPEGFEDCWEQLEIAPTSSWTEVRAAYKARVRDYHPDRVSNLAIGFRDYATRRTAAVNDVYARLRAALRPDDTHESEGPDEPTDSGRS